MTAKRSEIIVALALSALGVLHAVYFGIIMIPTSLWIDEIYSVREFSGPGAWATLTTYPEPNNHIFYNLLQSFLPTAGSYDPLAARTLSIAAAVIGVALLATKLCMAKRFLEAGVLSLLIGSSPIVLALLFSARGYGLQFALVCALPLFQPKFDGEDSRARLGIFTVLNALIVWTAPSALLMLFPWALLLIGLARKRLTALLTWVSAGAVTLLLHLPLIGPFIDAYLNFDEEQGELFRGVGGARHLARYLFGDASATFSILLGVAVCAAIIWYACRTKSPDRSPLLWLVALSIGLALAIATNSPPPRVFSPFVGVIMLSAIISTGALLRALADSRMRQPAVFVAIAALFLFIPQTRTFGGYQYHPVENWLGSAEFIHRAFPPGTHVFGNNRPQLLGVYLDDSYPRAKDFAMQSFREGTQIAIDTQVPPRDPLPDELLELKAPRVRIPQVRGGGQTIYFMPPAQANFELVETAALPDYTVFRPLGDRSPYALVLFTKEPIAEAGIIIETDRTFSPMAAQTWRYGQITVVSLARPIEGVALPNDLSVQGWFTGLSMDDSGDSVPSSK